MGRIFRLLAVCLVVGSAFFGGVGSSVLRAQQLIDIKADLVYPYKVDDTLSVLCLVGDFAAQHNGAVITADSAVRYSDDRLECFGNVLINKNTTYVYADRADYDGEKNIASLYAPLIKVVDQDVTMYAYNFDFNTLDNVGRYWGGGVMRRRVNSEEEDKEDKEDIMVSQRGYFISDNEEIVGVDGVEASGEGYLMSGDSVIYNTAVEQIHFFDKTNIWSNEEDYIYGDLGSYDKAAERYNIESNGYMLRPEQEIWSDTMIYYSARNIAIMYQDMQLDDTKNKSIAFGDYGQYWGDEERILLTRNPTLVNYDKSSTQSEPLYLRGDTIMLLSYEVGSGPMADGRSSGFDTSIFDALDATAVAAIEAEKSEGVDGDDDSAEGADGSLFDSVKAKVSYTREELRDKKREERYARKDARDEASLERQRAIDQRAAEKLAAQVAERDAKSAAKSRIERIKRYRSLMERELRLEEKISERLVRGRSIYTDSMILLRVVGDKMELARYIERDSLIAWEGLERWGDFSNDSIYRDALGREYVVERGVQEAVADVASADVVTDSMSVDSTYRVVVAYHNVRAFNKDFQMVSDSMVLETIDSTIRLFVKPVVWSTNNQMAAEKMDLYVKDGNLDYADLIDRPVMSSQVRENDSVYFNQVTGKDMHIKFENNEVTRNDVNGNVETLYFMLDDNNKEEVTTVAKIESGDATFYIEEKELNAAAYRTQPTYVFTPMDKRPSDVGLYLQDFVWYASRRPLLVDVLNREVRTSRRDVVDTLPRPTFEIAAQIDAERERLVESGEWSDRTDEVSVGSTEWMKSLGFTPGEPRDSGESK